MRATRTKQYALKRSVNDVASRGVVLVHPTEPDLRVQLITGFETYTGLVKLPPPSD